MKRIIRRNKPLKLATSLLSLLLLAGCGSTPAKTASTLGTSGSSISLTTSVDGSAEKASAEVELTDHMDRQVTVPTNPQNVVILDILPLPSVLTIYLGSAKTIKAMEPASMNAAKNSVLGDLFPEIQDVSTDIMSNEDVNIESLMAMNPDVVFFNAGNKELCEKLENAGLTCVGVSPVKWNYDCIRTYNEWIALLDQIYPDRAAGNEKTVDAYANEIYDEIQGRVASLEEKDRQKVLFLFQYDENTMITSGSSFFGQWWCDAVGAKNAAEEVAADNSNAKITMEQVYKWDPDVIIITNFTGTQPEDIYNNAIGDDDWSGVKAVKEKRVYKMPMGSYRSYTPGVDTPMTLQWLAQAVYPEIFPDYDVKEKVKDYYKTIYGVTLADEQVNRMYTPNRDAGKMN